jgi:hypothetical protein
VLHDGEVFRRTEDQLPRGNGMLMLRIIYHDKRKKLYDQACSLIDKSPRAALAFLQDYVDRTEGLPTKRIEKTIRRPATFVFSNPDGTETPALPEHVALERRQGRRAQRTRSSWALTLSRCGCEETEKGHPVETPGQAGCYWGRRAAPRALLRRRSRVAPRGGGAVGVAALRQNRRGQRRVPPATPSRAAGDDTTGVLPPARGQRSTDRRCDGP